MKCSRNSAADRKNARPEATSIAAAPSIATDNDVRTGRRDYALAKNSQNAGAYVQPRNEETVSNSGSNVVTGNINFVELNRADQQTTSENLRTVDGKSWSENGGDETGSWCDSGVTHWNRTTKLFRLDGEGRLVKSEGQTPVSTDDRCRVSRVSSLDQLRLRFQHQRKNAGRFRAELDHLKKKVIEAQHDLDKERNGRRKLEEWTDYLESQLRAYIASRSVVEKQ